MASAARSTARTGAPSPAANGRHSAPPAAAAAPVDPFAGADQLTQLVEQFGGSQGYRVRIFRKSERGIGAYVCTVDLSPELLDDVKSECGGGAYVCRIVGQRGAFVPDGTIHLEIDGPPLDRSAPAPAAAAAVSARRDEPVEDALVDREFIRELMRERIMGERRSSSLDVVALIGALSPIVIKLLEGGRSKLSADDIAAAVQKATGNNNSLRDTIGAVRELLEARELLGDSAPRERDSLIDLGRELIPPVVAAIRSRGDDARPVSFTPAPAPSPVPSDMASSPPLTAAGVPAWALELAPHMTQLLRVASNGDDPRDFAFSMLKFFIIGKSRGMLRELVAQDSAVDQVVTHFPEFAPYRTWLDEFVDESRIQLELKAAPEDPE